MPGLCFKTTALLWQRWNLFVSFSFETGSYNLELLILPVSFRQLRLGLGFAYLTMLVFMQCWGLTQDSASNLPPESAAPYSVLRQGFFVYLGSPGTPSVDRTVLEILLPLSGVLIRLKGCTAMPPYSSS